MAPTKPIDHRLARSPHNRGARNEYLGDDGVWYSLKELERIVPPTKDGMCKRIKIFGYESELIFYRGRLTRDLINLHKLPEAEKPATRKPVGKALGMAKGSKAKLKKACRHEPTIRPIAIGQYDPLIAPRGVVYLPGNLKVDYRV